MNFEVLSGNVGFIIVTVFFLRLGYARTEPTVGYLRTYASRDIGNQPAESNLALFLSPMEKDKDYNINALRVTLLPNGRVFLGFMVPRVFIAVF